MASSRVMGLAKGIIVDINDPSGYKRVRVRIPQLHGAMTDDFYNDARLAKVSRTPDEALPWAEVCNPYGSDVGPELNQVVVVGFLSGNPSTPIVLGWLAYEYTNDETKTQLQNVSLFDSN